MKKDNYFERYLKQYYKRIKYEKSKNKRLRSR